MIPQSFIQDLLSRVDIVDVIERYLPLKKGGANYFACCPFHGEKSASFSVSPAKQFYHCFGCGAHGSAIGFLMEYSGLGYVDAIRELAQQAGMTVPEEPRGAGHAPRTDPSLTEVMQTAARYYQAQLRQHPQAIDYLKGRGLTGEIAQRFGIGYAPGGAGALRGAFPDYNAPELLQTGLVIENDEGRRYDRFRERIMFPIHDQRGNVIAFGGRVLGQGEPKYLNSPETPLFEKGRELYGLTLARHGIRDKGHAIVVEGYMDVVALAQFGIDNAVATLGTATTPTHIQKLLRQTSRIVFCFDGDAAGRRAAWRALESALEALGDDKTLAFLFLPEIHDPDSYVREFGAEAFLKAAAEATPLAEFMLQQLREDCDLRSAEGRARLVHEARPLVTRVAAPVLRLQLVKAVADMSGMTQPEVEELYGLRSLAPPPRQKGPARAPRTPRRAPPTAVETLLRIAIQQPTLAARLRAERIPADTPAGLALIAIIDAMDVGDIAHDCALGALTEHFREHPAGSEVARAAAEVVDSPFEDEVLETLFNDTLERLEQSSIGEQIAELIAKQRHTPLSDLERRQLANLLTLKSRTGASAKSPDK